MAESDTLSNKFISRGLYLAERSKLAYGSIYNNVDTNKASENAVYFGFWPWDEDTVSIIVDLDGDLDFAEERVHTKIFKSNGIDFTIAHPDNPDQKVETTLLWKPLDTGLRSFIYKYMGKEGRTRNGTFLLDASHFPRYASKTYHADTVALGKQPLFLVLEDYATNGLFNDSNDRLGFAMKYERAEADIHHGGMALGLDSTFIHDQKTYKIVRVDPFGNYLDVIPWMGEHRTRSYVGKRFPSYKMFNQDSIAVDIGLLPMSKNYLIYEFWGSWCAGCHQQVPIIKEFLQKFDSQTDIVGLNYGNNPKSGQKFIEKYNLSYPSYYLGDDLEGFFSVVSFPSFMLVDRNRNVLLFGDLSEVERYLTNPKTTQ